MSNQEPTNEVGRGPYELRRELSEMAEKAQDIQGASRPQISEYDLGVNHGVRLSQLQADITKEIDRRRTALFDYMNGVKDSLNQPGVSDTPPPPPPPLSPYSSPPGRRPGEAARFG